MHPTTAATIAALETEYLPHNSVSPMTPTAHRRVCHHGTPGACTATWELETESRAVQACDSHVLDVAHEVSDEELIGARYAAAT